MTEQHLWPSQHVGWFWHDFDRQGHLTFMWPWPTRSYFTVYYNCHNFILHRWILIILGQSNTYDLTDMLDDFNITFIWPWPTCGFPILKKYKKVKRCPRHAVALVQILFNFKYLTIPKLQILLKLDFYTKWTIFPLGDTFNGLHNLHYIVHELHRSFFVWFLYFLMLVYGIAWTGNLIH